MGEAIEVRLADFDMVNKQGIQITIGNRSIQERWASKNIQAKELSYALRRLADRIDKMEEKCLSQ